jgi:hypothetical protein
MIFLRFPQLAQSSHRLSSQELGIDGVEKAVVVQML